jgi:hypothetical protein
LSNIKTSHTIRIGSRFMNFYKNGWSVLLALKHTDLERDFFIGDELAIPILNSDPVTILVRLLGKGVSNEQK